MNIKRLRVFVTLALVSVVIAADASGAEYAHAFFVATNGIGPGGIAVDPAWFAPVTGADPEWSRLATVAQGHVLKARLSDHGITDYGVLRFRGGGERATGALELFVAGQPMPLARWPGPDQHTAQSQEDIPFSQMGIIDGLSFIFEDGFDWGDTSAWN